MMLESAGAWLREMLSVHVSVPVTYNTGAGPPLAVDAVPGRTLFRADTDYGTTIRTESRDFIIAADRLPRPPRKGDVIMYNLRRYEVLAPNGESVWRWSDPWHIAYRIHTKETLP